MDLSKIQELLKIVADSGVAEVEIEEDDFKLTVRRNQPTVMMQQPSMPQYGMGYGMPPMYGGPQMQQAPSQGAPQAAGQPPQGAPQQTQQPASNPAPASGSAPNNGASAETASSPGSDDGDEVATAENETVVKAPIVGTFYRAPSPDSDPYVDVGDTVQDGDILCIIEAMKLMNEIECETPGTIKKILVEDAEPVEFDQPLFVVEQS
jgi:acetyl-CoA carboxylase biotin carboxyl carrier protein